MGPEAEFTHEAADPHDAPVALAPTSPVAAKHRWGLGAYVVVELAYLLTSAAFLPLLSGGSPLPLSTVLVAVAAPSVIAAGLALLITMIRGNGPGPDLRLFWSGRAVGLGLMFGFGGLFFIVPAAMLYATAVGPDATSAAGAAFGGFLAAWPWAVAVFVLVVFLAPVCEEIVYRGLLWGAVEQRWGRWAALAVTTVLFAVAHLEFERTPLLILIAIPIGLARLYSGSLLASIVVHQVVNLLPGVVLMLSVAGAIPPV